MKKWIPIWAVPLFFVLAGLTVWLRLSVIRKTYELNQVNQSLANNKKELERLKVNLAQKKSPRKLEFLARKNLKLFPPLASQVVQLEFEQE